MLYTFQMSSNKLKLDFINVTLEPYSSLSLDKQIISRASHVGNGKSNTGGSSGSGHGGHGGSGLAQTLVGVSYGSFRIPRLSGQPGAAPVFPMVTGNGGGLLELVVQNTAHLDGVISAKGGNANSPRGSGASGGSILLYTLYFHGQGLLDVSGGDGDLQYGGGGAGGRISVYSKFNNYLGYFVAMGGASNVEPGGAGTVYLERITKNETGRIEILAHRNYFVNNDEFESQNRTLYVNAHDRISLNPQRNVSLSFGDFTKGASARTWITLDPDEENVTLSELQLYGGAQVLFIIVQKSWKPLAIFISRMQGDRKGRLYIGYNQSFLSLESFLPFNMVIYQGGVTSMQGELLVAGVTVDVDGILQNCQNVTIADGGIVIMKEMYDFKGRATKVCILHHKFCRKIGRFFFGGRERRNGREYNYV